MNQRQKELLRLLLIHKEGPQQIKTLSKQLECAEKTVRNDLDRLEELLHHYADVSIIRKPGLGVWLEMNEETRTDILSRLFSNEPKTNEERLFEITYELLTSKQSVTLQYLAEHYYASKSVVKKDLDTISEWIKVFDLELTSKPRIGHTIKGTERNKRNALAHLSELIPTKKDKKNYVLDLFQPYEISIVKKLLKDLVDQFSLSYTDRALESLKVHTLIMIKRTRQQSQVFVQESEKEETKKQPEYYYANWLFDQLESTFGLTFPDTERVYFTWHLMSGKRMEEAAETFLTYDKDLSTVLRICIEKMERLTLFDFTKDPILEKGLAVHLHSVLNRLKFGFPIKNPLLSDIKKMYPYTFSTIILTIEEIKNRCQITIPEDEAAYLVLHFQASIERMENNKLKKKKVVIVCHLGVGMSHLLEAKIEQQYHDINIIGCLGKSELMDFVKRQPVDFIISTLPLESVEIEHVVLSPLFDQNDKKKLSQFIETFEKNKTEQNSQKVPACFLHAHLVHFQLDKVHRYEVVEFLAKDLYEKGFVTKEYIHSALNRERASATAIGGGIAIPHGDSAFVKKSAIAIATMKEPLDWATEKISLVFMLAITKENQKDFKSVIAKIAEIRDHPLVVHALSGEKNYDSFIKVFLQESK